MKASRRFSLVLGQAAKTLTLGGLLAWTCSTYAANLTPAKVEITYAVTWNELVGSTTGLNNDSTSDTWVAILDIKDVPLLEYPDCPFSPCPVSIDVDEQDSQGFSFSVSSTSEIPSDNPAIRADNINSFDRFDFDSNLSPGIEFFRFYDTDAGVYYPPEGTGSVSWRFDRRVFSPTLAPGYVERSTEGFIAALKDTSLTYDVTEFFVNNTLQVAYTKTGTAKVTKVRVLSDVAPTAPLTCRYQVASDWGTGYVAFVYLKNETAEPVNGWQVAVNFQNAISVTNSWSAVLSGTTPTLTAGPLAWNQTIYPGQEINFGFQGSKIAGQTSAASVSGSSCR